MKIIAFDVGTVRVGVAISDDTERIALPVTVLERSDDPDRDAAAMARLAGEYDAGRIVVGLPLNLRGEQGPAAQNMLDFVDRLREHAAVEVVLWDERMTTAVAERVMIGADVSRSRRRESVDKVAAVVILQGYLDARAASQQRGADEA